MGFIGSLVRFAGASYQRLTTCYRPQTAVKTAILRVQTDF